MRYQLRGLLAATFTPFQADNSMDLRVLPRMVDHLERTGVTGIYVCGSTGEGMSLTTSERCELAEAFVTLAKGRLSTVVHVGHNSIAEARQLAEHAMQVDADVVSATAPSYYKITSVEVLVDCMAEIAAAAPNLPFYYYHIPALTGAALDMVQFLEIAERKIPNLAGLKYTAPTVFEYQACRESMDGKFDILWGCDEMLLSALSVGAQGAIGSTYNIAAILYKQLIQAFEIGDLQRAKELQLKSVNLVRVLVKFPFHAAVKHILNRMGLPCGPCRLPLTGLAKAQETDLENELLSSGVGEWLFDQGSLEVQYEKPSTPLRHHFTKKTGVQLPSD